MTAEVFLDNPFVRVSATGRLLLGYGAGKQTLLLLIFGGA
jgi:hypothetical protein